MKRLILVLLVFILSACAPSEAKSGTPPAPPTAPDPTRPAPIVEHNAAPPSSATVVAAATLGVRTPTVSATRTPATATAVPSPTPLGPQEINGVPLSSIIPMPPETADNVRSIYEKGQELGRDPRAFSKLGDSTILNPHFLGPFDTGDYKLGEFAYLQPTIDRYTGSFERHGVATHFGLHSWTVFDPMWADKDWCEPNEHSLACETRLQNPSILFVRLGSNDSGAPSGFRFNVKKVIEYAIANGIIPIIGTKADRFEGSNENNDILRELAAEYHVPLWDFDLVAETLPGHGLGPDAVHLVIDELPHDYTQPDALQRGHATQDLTALMALDQVRRLISEEA